MTWHKNLSEPEQLKVKDKLKKPQVRGNDARTS